MSALAKPAFNCMDYFTDSNADASVSGDVLPLVARITGVPGNIMNQFASSLGEQLKQIRDCEETIADLRNRLVDELHSAIHNGPPEKRHALLAMKRDCFNGRPLAHYKQETAWNFLESASEALATQIVLGDKKLESLKKAFTSAHQIEHLEQYRKLNDLVDDPLFQCGLAVASSSLVAETERLKKRRPEEYGRREKRLVSTLLRYLSRASVKLSPFSTFTQVGLCRVDRSNQQVRLLSDSWEHHSTVRLRRHILDRCADMLCLYGPWRHVLKVRLNDSIVRLEDGRTIHRRPPRFYPNMETNELSYQRESLVRASFQSSIAHRLPSLLTDASLTYADALTTLARDAEAVPYSTLKEEMDQLIELGFVYLEPPWTSDEGHLESAMLRELRNLPDDAILQPFLSTLERIVILERDLLKSQQPAQSLQELQVAMDELLASAGRLAGLPADMKVPLYSIGHEIYQDVWRSPRGDRNQPLLCVGRKHLDEAARNVEPLLHYSQVFDHKLDLLYGFGSLLEGHYGKECKVPLLEAFDLLSGLFKDYIASEAQVKTRKQHYFTWNPLQLPIIEELSSLREFLRDALDKCCIDSEEGRIVSLAKICNLLDSVPDKFKRGNVGACIFLQPANSEGTLWVANRIKEGTGRMSSRYTPLMPESFRRKYSDGLAQRSVVVDHDSELPILDIHSISGDTLNLHEQQTQKTLVLPCTHSGIDETRRLSLAQMSIKVQPDGWAALEDKAGQRFLTAYIGLAGSTYLPTLVKFLCAFGPTDTIALYPRRLEKSYEDIVVRERTTAGNVVLARKSWTVPVERLREILREHSNPAAFERLHRFLHKVGMPHRVFVSEKLISFPRGSHSKPQYLDLTSPLFIAILHSIVTAAKEPLLFVEALPSPDSFLPDSNGQKWAVELIADAIPLGRFRTAPVRSQNISANWIGTAAATNYETVR